MVIFHFFSPDFLFSDFLIIHLPRLKDIDYYIFNLIIKNCSMNKSELISAVAAEAGLSKVDAKKAIEAFVSTVTTTLASGDKVALIGFGTFSVTEKSARTGINPATKQTINIPAKKVAKFKAGAELNDKIK